MNWGEQIEDAFNVIIFLYVETHIRLKRLREREVYLFGAADSDFLEWRHSMIKALRREEVSPNTSLG